MTHVLLSENANVVPLYCASWGLTAGRDKMSVAVYVHGALIRQRPKTFFLFPSFGPRKQPNCGLNLCRLLLTNRIERKGRQHGIGAVVCCCRLYAAASGVGVWRRAAGGVRIRCGGCRRAFRSLRPSRRCQAAVSRRFPAIRRSTDACCRNIPQRPCRRLPARF